MGNRLAGKPPYAISPPLPPLNEGLRAGTTARALSLRLQFVIGAGTGKGVIAGECANGDAPIAL